jgi:hypothetical protein
MVSIKLINLKTCKHIWKMGTKSIKRGKSMRYAGRGIYLE